MVITSLWNVILAREVGSFPRGRFPINNNSYRALVRPKGAALERAGRKLIMEVWEAERGGGREWWGGSRSYGWLRERRSSRKQAQ